MKCRFPVADVGGITIAVLLCEKNHRHLGLLLHPSGDEELQDPARRLYYVSWVFKSTSLYRIYRFAELGDDLYNLRFRGKTFTAEWHDIYICPSPRPQDRPDPTHRVLKLLPDCFPPVPFRIPRWLIGTMISLNLHPTSGRWTSACSTWHSWVDFHGIISSGSVRLVLGLCARSEASSGRRCHWAWAQPGTDTSWNDLSWRTREHDCDADHIDTWAGKMKTFGNLERTIKLTFVPCQFSTDATLVLDLELGGTVYDTMQRRANIFLPPRSTPSSSPLRSSRHPTCAPEHARQSLDAPDSRPSERVNLDAVGRIRAELLRLQGDLAQLLGDLPSTTAQATAIPVRSNLNPGSSTGPPLDSFELSPLHMAAFYGISTPLS